jgi:hypothetical protein
VLFGRAEVLAGGGLSGGRVLVAWCWRAGLAGARESVAWDRGLGGVWAVGPRGAQEPRPPGGAGVLLLGGAEAGRVRCRGGRGRAG